jgi:PHD/YefM family antitoxin component YafN of YafNO toxin-antitoxin module
MKTITATKELSSEDLIDQVQNAPIILLRGGRPAAVVMSLDDDDDLEWLQRELDPQFIASIARAREDVRQGKGVSHDEVVKMFGLE